MRVLRFDCQPRACAPEAQALEGTSTAPRDCGKIVGSKSHTGYESPLSQGAFA